MKSTKLLWSIVICLALGLLVSLLFNAGIIDLSKASKKINFTGKVFQEITTFRDTDDTGSRMEFAKGYSCY